jgi:DNA-directed RNA polymerase subunit F
MDSANLQRAWEHLAKEAARESDPKKHLKLIEELLSIMSQLQAARKEDKRTEDRK